MEERRICTLDFDVSEHSNAAEEVVNRLDDGNDFPGFEVRKEDGEYAVYEVS